MSQRHSEYPRRPRDEYNTPAWVTDALCDQMSIDGLRVWEPACGSGQMVRALMARGAAACGTDIRQKPTQDFLTYDEARDCDAIITNPPYEIAREYCEHALKLMQPVNGSVAMLLRTDFDHAVSRAHLFRDCPAFAAKIVLMKRIVWFVEANGKPKASPSYNHAWYVWRWRHSGPPTIIYGPVERGIFNQNVNLRGPRKSPTRARHADLFAHPTQSRVAGRGTGPAPRRETGLCQSSIGAPAAAGPTFEGAVP